MKNPFKQESRWQLKQRAACPGRYYGDTGTIHGTQHLDVETHNGRVVSVWFRCQMMPFKQVEVSSRRAEEMDGVASSLPALNGVELLD